MELLVRIGRGSGGMRTAKQLLRHLRPPHAHQELIANRLRLSHHPLLYTTSAAPAPIASKPAVAVEQRVDALARLEDSIERRQSALALTYFQQLGQPPSTLILQKLAILLAKQQRTHVTRGRQHAMKAIDILRSVYRLKGFRADDYTKLASIYVVDACLRYNLLDEALEIYEEAYNQSVFLDLPAYDALLKALVAADKLNEAVEIVHELTTENEVSFMEQSYLPLLMAFVEKREYDSAMNLMVHGEERGVVFTTETYHPLMELTEDDDDPSDEMIAFLSHIEDAWEEAKMLTGFDDEEVDDDDDQAEPVDDGDDNYRA